MHEEQEIKSIQVITNDNENIYYEVGKNNVMKIFIGSEKITENAVKGFYYVMNYKLQWIASISVSCPVIITYSEKE
jgi:hypothetical protein